MLDPPAILSRPFIFCTLKSWQTGALLVEGVAVGTLETGPLIEPEQMVGNTFKIMYEQQNDH